MTRITKKQARMLDIPVCENRRKYGNKKPVMDGIQFDSKKEANYYAELKLRKRAGDIKDFKLQPEFELQAGFRDSEGKWQRPIKYIADFLIIHNDGSQEVVDTKGYKTKEYRIKAKLFKFKYPDIKFTEV